MNRKLARIRQKQKSRYADEIAAVEAQGVEEKDVQTANISVNRLDYGPNKGQFSANNQVTVRVRKVDMASAVVGAATGAATAAAARVSTVTVFNYFGRKEELFFDRGAQDLELAREALAQRGGERLAFRLRAGQGAERLLHPAGQLDLPGRGAQAALHVGFLAALALIGLLVARRIFERRLNS